jgi:hypothetical protein
MRIFPFQHDIGDLQQLLLAIIGEIDGVGNVRAEAGIAGQAFLHRVAVTGHDHEKA